MLSKRIEETNSNSIAELIRDCAKPALAGKDMGMNTFNSLASTIDDAVREKLSNKQLAALTKPLLNLIEKADPGLLVELIHACAMPAATDNINRNKNAFYWLGSAIRNAIRNNFTHEQLATLIKPILFLIEKTDSNTLAIFIQACAKSAGAGTNVGVNTFYLLVKAIFHAIEPKASNERLILLTKPFLALLKIADSNSLSELIKAFANAPEVDQHINKNTFYWFAKAVHVGTLRALSFEQLAMLTTPLLILINRTDPNSLVELIEACSTSAKTSNDKGINTFYWLANAIFNGAHNKLSSEELITLTQAFVRLVEKTDVNTHAMLIQACAKSAEAGDDQGKNAFHWLTEAIYFGARNMLSAEQLTTLTQPFISLVEKADANTLATFVQACTKPAEVGDDKGKNAFYWLTLAIYKGVCKRLSAEQLTAIIQPFVSLIEKADATTIAMLFQSCSKFAEVGAQQGLNAFYWLTSAINEGKSEDLSPEMLRNVSKPLLLLLEKLTTPEQIKQVSDAIAKDGVMGSVRDQLKIYLIQNREHEDVVAKLARLKSYLDPSKPLYGFIAKHNSSIFVRSESDIVKEIRAEVVKLQRYLDQQLLQLNNRSLNNANFSWEKVYSAKDETIHGMGL